MAEWILLFDILITDVRAIERRAIQSMVVKRSGQGGRGLNNWA
jgi:hypothetical protein